LGTEKNAEVAVGSRRKRLSAFLPVSTKLPFYDESTRVETFFIDNRLGRNIIAIIGFLDGLILNPPLKVACFDAYPNQHPMKPPRSEGTK
jgi:hypothetical protein